MLLRHTVFFLLSLYWLTGSAKAQSKLPSRFTSIETGFIQIPDSIQTTVYWHWLSDNISEQGVIKDLEAMKKAGINRAFIAYIGLDNVPYGKVKMFSAEWWNILHAALKAATRLNIEIGIFNSPGWSQSGGPWVKPQQAMRYLTSSQLTVQGPVMLHKKLLVPKEDFRDVKVIAYPVSPGYFTDITALKPVITSQPQMDSLSNVMDGYLSTFIPLEKEKQFSIDIKSSADYTVRSISIDLVKTRVKLEGDIQAEINGRYILLKHFLIDRSNPEINTGFVPYGTAVLSIPATTAKNFRVIITGVSERSGIAELRLSATPMVEQFLEKTLAKMHPSPQPLWSTYLWEKQPVETSAYTIDPLEVIDISSFMQPDGMLDWKVPAGTWVIERTGMAPTNITNSPAPPEGRGLEIDKMSTAHIREHFDAFLGEIIKRIPAADRKTWKVVVEDSYEMGSQNWTDNFITDFRSAYKYDPVPYLPVLQGKVVGNEDISDRFLWDFRRLIADEISYKYVGGLRDISHRNGMTTWLENYGHWGYPGEFLQYGGQSDEVAGEFWNEGTLGDIENRSASSAAHIYGKTKVSSESFTAAGSPFARYPAMLKKRGDRFFTEGINNTLLHVYIHQPDDNALPGLAAWYSVEFNRQNTWFFEMKSFIQYIKRCNLLLQQGKYVAEVAYFIGEDAPKMTGVTDPPLPRGYSFDYINGEVIREKLAVKNGKLVLPDGMSYRVLVLPKLKTMRPELLAKIKELVKQGAVVLGPKPTSAPGLKNYPASDNLVQKTAEELWGKNEGKTISVNHYGKGMVISGMDMGAVLDMIKILPDVTIANSDSVLFIHRQLGEGDIYFLSNQANSKVDITAQFRTTGKVPELWDAVSGTMRPLPDYNQTNNTTNVPLQLAPAESAFIIFRNNAGTNENKKSNYPPPANTSAVKGPWTVSFSRNMRGPVNPVLFDTLSDWSLNANDSIKYYSGSAVYKNTFDIDTIQNGTTYLLDLGMAKAIANVTVNGIETGGAWTPPYQVNITAAIKAGKNKLEIKVTNTWVNRLIGDSFLPAEQRKTSVLFGPDPKNGLQSSGLLGPVKIVPCAIK